MDAELLKKLPQNDRIEYQVRENGLANWFYWLSTILILAWVVGDATPVGLIITVLALVVILFFVDYNFKKITKDFMEKIEIVNAVNRWKKERRKQ